MTCVVEGCRREADVDFELCAEHFNAWGLSREHRRAEKAWEVARADFIRRTEAEERNAAREEGE